MSATDILDTGLAMARIESLRVAGPASLEIVWAEGQRQGLSDLVDLTPAIGSYKAYRALRDNPDLFATARLEEDGFAIVWEGETLDMSAELVETLADQTMTPKEFAAFLRRNRLTQDAAAALLGRSRRQVGYYLSAGPVPRVIALACIGYETISARKRQAAATAA